MSRQRSLFAPTIERNRSFTAEEHMAEMLAMLRRVASEQRRALIKLAQVGFLADPGLTLEVEALIERIESQTSEANCVGAPLLDHETRKRGAVQRATVH